MTKVEHTSPTDDLAKLSAGATPGPLRGGHRCDGSIRATVDGERVSIGSDIPSGDAAYWSALANAHRTGRLVPAPAAPQATEEPVAWAGGIYMASKTSHASRWRSMRENGLPIISTWIDEAGKGETACFTDLWRRCVGEAASARALIVYREPGEVLKGAFVEVGAALAVGVPVFAVGCDEFSFVSHSGVKRCTTIEHAINCALSRPLYAAPAASRIGVSEEEIRDDLLAFLCRKYVQRADARQKSMGLQYTTAETHDLAKEVARFTVALLAAPRAGGETGRQPYTLQSGEGGTFLQAEAGQLFICADINSVRRCLAAVGAPPADQDANREGGR